MLTSVTDKQLTSRQNDYQKTPVVAVIKRQCTGSQTRGDKLFHFSRMRKKASLFFCCLTLFQGDERGSRVHLVFTVFSLRCKTQSLTLSQTHKFGFGNLPLQTYGQILSHLALGSTVPLSLVLFLSFYIFTLSFVQVILLFLFFKWIVHPELKNLSFIHAHVDPNPFFFCVEHNTIHLRNSYWPHLLSYLQYISLLEFHHTELSYDICTLGIQHTRHIIHKNSLEQHKGK